jgi:hypothetical protein
MAALAIPVVQSLATGRASGLSVTSLWSILRTVPALVAWQELQYLCGLAPPRLFGF